MCTVGYPFAVWIGVGQLFNCGQMLVGSGGEPAIQGNLMGEEKKLLLEEASSILLLRRNETAITCTAL